RRCRSAPPQSPALRFVRFRRKESSCTPKKLREPGRTLYRPEVAASAPFWSFGCRGRAAANRCEGLTPGMAAPPGGWPTNRCRNSPFAPRSEHCLRVAAADVNHVLRQQHAPQIGRACKERHVRRTGLERCERGVELRDVRV